MTNPTNKDKPSTVIPPSKKEVKAAKKTTKELAMEMVETPLVEFNQTTGGVTTKNLHVEFLVHLTAGGDKEKIKELLKDPAEVNRKLMADPYGNVALALYSRAVFHTICNESTKDPIEWGKLLVEMKRRGLADLVPMTGDGKGGDAKTHRSQKAIGEVIDLVDKGKGVKGKGG